MSAQSSIEWTDKTWNPTRGCSRVGPECDNCYAMHFAHRFSNEVMGKPGPYKGLTVMRPETAKRPGVDWSGKVRLVEDALETPLSWRKPKRIFVDSMSDLFHEGLPDIAIDSVFGVMGACEDQERGHTFQVLTKRADRMLDYMLTRGHRAWNSRRLGPDAFPPRNIWLGVSVGNKRDGLPRIELLRAAPAAVRFLSVEPLLEDLGTLDLRGIDWVIVGGESGAGARRFGLPWARSIVKQCSEAGVACFVKQLGALPSDWTPGLADDHDLVKLTNRKGGDMAEWPADLRVRQFPEVRR